MIKSVKINANGYIVCPVCGEKTKVKVNPDTVLVRFPLYCQHCHTETIVGYVKPTS